MRRDWFVTLAGIQVIGVLVLLSASVAGATGALGGAVAAALGTASLGVLPMRRSTADTRGVALMVALAVASLAIANRSPEVAAAGGLAAVVLGARLANSVNNLLSVEVGLLVAVGLAAGGSDGSLISSVTPSMPPLWAAAALVVVWPLIAFAEMHLPAAVALGAGSVDPDAYVTARPAPARLAPVSVVALVATTAGGALLTGAAPTFDRSGFEIDFGAGQSVGAPRRDHPGLSGVLDAADNPALSDQVVLRVRSDIPMYWRGVTYNEYDGRYWYDTLDRPSYTFPAGGTTVSTRPAPENSVEVLQTFTLEQTGLDVFLGADRMRTLYYDGFSGTYTPIDDAVHPDERLPSGAKWTVVSDVAIVSGDDLRRADDDPFGVPATVLELYAVEDDVSPETAALAAEITAGAATTYDRVRAIEDWFDDNVHYDRWDAEVPEGVDPVDHLLFDTRRGYCEQIASAMAVMARSQGIPARVVVGYVPGDYDAETGEWISRGRDGHAWTEIYFPGIGWQAFDPTSGVPLTADALDDAERPEVDLSIPWQLWGGAGVVALAAVGVALRRRRPQAPPEVHRRIEALGARLELDWADAATLRDRLADLERVGVDPAVVADAGRTIEAALYAPEASGTDASDRARLDAALARLEGAVEERRRALVSAS